LLPVPEKKNFCPHFFNITPMGKKFNSKNHLTPAPNAIISCFRSKINKNTATILGKF
jgi:hypothetical protein